MRIASLIMPVLSALSIALLPGAAHAQPRCVITNQRVECDNGVGGRVTPRGDVWLDDGRFVRREDLGIVRERDNYHERPGDERRQERRDR